MDGEHTRLDESNPSSGPPAVLSEEAERERKRNQAKLARMQVGGTQLTSEHENRCLVMHPF